LLQVINGSDDTWVLPLSSVVSIPHAFEGTVLLVQSLAEMLKKSRAEEEEGMKQRGEISS
jgi:hypothetical protein